MRHPVRIVVLPAPRWASAIPAYGRNALLWQPIRRQLPGCRLQSPARFDSPSLFSLEGCGHKLASPPRSWCHSPSHRSARRNRAAPTALGQTIGLVRSPTASGTPCRNCLAGNTTLLVLFACSLLCLWVFAFCAAALCCTKNKALHGGLPRLADRAVKGAV